MNRTEAAHVLENSQLVSTHFTQEALTAAYIESLECLYRMDCLEAAYSALLARLETATK